MKKTTRFKLTEETMLAACPHCGTSWQGESYYDLYAARLNEEKTEFSDDDLMTEIKNRHRHSHQSLLIEVVFADGDTIHVCPDCKSSFKKTEQP